MPRGRWPTAGTEVRPLVSVRSTAPQYVTWLGGTTLGALGGDLIGDPGRFGLDAIYPMFFLGLLIAEIKDRRSGVVALAGGLVALALVEVAPAGLPVLAASVVALWGLRAEKESA